MKRMVFLHCYTFLDNVYSILINSIFLKRKIRMALGKKIKTLLKENKSVIVDDHLLNSIKLDQK